MWNNVENTNKVIHDYAFLNLSFYLVSLVVFFLQNKTQKHCFSGGHIREPDTSVPDHAAVSQNYYQIIFFSL